MSQTIHGEISMRLWSPANDDDDPPWAVMVPEVGYLLGQNYELWNSLFGPGGDHFKPLFLLRGFSPRASAAVKARFDESSETLWASWASWAELAAIDWDEEATEVERLLVMYQRQPDGQLRFVWLSDWRNLVYDLFPLGHPGRKAALEAVANCEFGQNKPDGAEWIVGDRLYRLEVRRRRRRDELEPDFLRVLEITRLIAEEAGPENVHLNIYISM